MFWISTLFKADLRLVFAIFLMWFVFSNRDNVYVLYHNYARDSGKGNSECYFKVGSIHDTYRKTYGQNGNITIDSLEESSNATVLNDTLKNVELKARGKWKNVGLNYSFIIKLKRLFQMNVFFFSFDLYLFQWSSYVQLQKKSVKFF